MPYADTQDVEKSIKAIQNVAIMLTGATEFVCEKRILKIFSSDIEVNLEKLENDIASFKKNYPGKFPETLESDSSLSKIRDIATMLKGDNADIEAKCLTGDLGNELTAGVAELKGIVKDIWDTFSGKVSRYTFTDRIAKFGTMVKSSLLALSPLVSHTGKIILAVIVVAIISFFYLFFTMESENILLEGIKNDRIYIKTQKDTIQKKRQEYKEITERLKTLYQGELIRQDKIELLDLSLKERKIKELIEKTMFSVEKREKNIKEKN
jgi:hypothetical protein